MKALVAAAMLLVACGGERPEEPDPFCSGGSKLSIGGSALSGWCACSMSDEHLDIMCEYKLDPSGLVAWTRHFVAASVGLPSFEGELRVWDSDPLGGSPPSHNRASFSGWAVGGSACVEARMGVAGSTRPAVVRMYLAMCE